ncbi:DUF3302 domain-containing protein [Corallococcus sp. BB11-1]|uniref:DUF3302 domain-containing protein n=1 Tax=Corallococcus sp. BB11-1 TaxID=2996783 RepID=UPI0010E16FE4|nr:DUF3302 domain-containing protein [Corallococcus sp. BB11-1]MCY1037181.1 DUF3302 domain-containing protein [Corallococcus sp. BB11-1]RYZ46562.1 MAG: DUF3302 domain-containing protein [Myxococcaceae bacterium]
MRWLGWGAWVPLPAHASLLSGGALDTVAEVLSWVVIVVAPVVMISAFWLLHIMPEKVAERRNHPQLEAIKTLCFLSLFFGGLLWPLAWLWAYSKPTLYKMAYGEDQVRPTHGPELAEAGEAMPPVHREPYGEGPDTDGRGGPH